MYLRHDHTGMPRRSALAARNKALSNKALSNKALSNKALNNTADTTGGS